MKLSIIIPVYNVENYLERCVESVLNQNLYEKDFEVILINDGSTDGSGEIAKKMAQNFPNAKYFEQKNAGLGSARNVGIENAVGDYLMFLDSDDWLVENSLAKVLAKAFENDLDLLIFNIQRIYGSGSIINTEIDYAPDEINNGRSFLKKNRVNILPCANLYLRKVLVENDIRFEEGVFYEDPDFYLKFILASERISFTKEMVYNYFFNENSITLKSEKSHNNKKIYDYGMALCRILELQRSETEAIRQRIDFLAEKYQLWLMRMIYRNDIDFEVVKRILNRLIELEKYPYQIKQQKISSEDRAQVFYFNRFILSPFFFKRRFSGALFLMKVYKQLR